MEFLAIVVTIGVSIMITLVMNLSKGWSINDDEFGLNKKPLLILVVMDAPFAVVATYYMWGPTPINIGGFAIAVVMSIGLFVLMTALLVELVLLDFQKRHGSGDDDHRGGPPTRPKPRPSQGLTHRQRRDLYAKLGMSSKLRDSVS